MSTPSSPGPGGRLRFPGLFASLCIATFAFLAGSSWLPVPAALHAGEPGMRPDLQGREPPTPPAGRNRSTTSTPPSTPMVYGGDDSSAMSGDGMIAVTGSYGVGTSVLYLIDTKRRQLAVYEARGGTNSMRRIHLVGARNIELDLQLEGYNDESEYSYRQLKQLFERRGITDTAGPSVPAEAPASTGTAPEPGRTGTERR